MSFAKAQDLLRLAQMAASRRPVHGFRILIFVGDLPERRLLAVARPMALAGLQANKTAGRRTQVWG